MLMLKIWYYRCKSRRSATLLSLIQKYQLYQGINLFCVVFRQWNVSKVSENGCFCTFSAVFKSLEGLIFQLELFVIWKNAGFNVSAVQFSTRHNVSSTLTSGHLRFLVGCSHLGNITWRKHTIQQLLAIFAISEFKITATLKTSRLILYCALIAANTEA